MDIALITLIAIIVLPVVILMALRVNAALVFLSLCLGAVLTQFVADDAGWFVTLAAGDVPQAGSLTDASIKLGLLLLPVILTTVFMIRTVHGHGKLFLNLLPASGVGFLGALLAVPFLPAEAAANVTGSVLWSEVSKLQDAIVGLSALLCLFVLWLQRPKTGHHHEGGKHAKHHG